MIEPQRQELRHTDAVCPVIHVRVLGVELDADDQVYIRRKLRTKLAKFAGSIERVSVRVGDVNGPRGSRWSSADCRASS